MKNEPTKVTMLLRVGDSEVLNEVATIEVAGTFMPFASLPPEGVAPEARGAWTVSIPDIVNRLAIHLGGRRALNAGMPQWYVDAVGGIVIDSEGDETRSRAITVREALGANAARDIAMDTWDPRWLFANADFVDILNQVWHHQLDVLGAARNIVEKVQR